MKKIFILCLAFIFTFTAFGCAFAAKDKNKIKFNNKKLKKIELVQSPSLYSTINDANEEVEDITILGEPIATQGQMINFIKSRNQNPKINCTVEELVAYYYEEAGREDIRPDIAICQAIKETGTWNYGGDVLPEQNNYCGLGATGNKEPGLSFATPQIGIRAHIQHLKAYATKNPPTLEIVDPRYELIEKFRPQIFGKIQTWTGLNGVWAVPGNQYGQEILRLWAQAQLPDASEESLEAANKKLENDSRDAQNYFYRGLIYYEREDFKNAEEDFEKALEINPNFTEARYNLALTQAKNGNFKDAIKSYDKFLKIETNNTYALFNRGNLKLNLKKYSDAIKDFEDALKLEDRFVDAQNNIAVAYFREKKYVEALNTIRTASEVNTTNKIVNENKKTLESCLKK